MPKKNQSVQNKGGDKTKRGKGIIDDIIEKIPFEMHVPAYNYCGIGL